MFSYWKLDREIRYKKILCQHIQYRRRKTIQDMLNKDPILNPLDTYLPEFIWKILISRHVVIHPNIKYLKKKSNMHNKKHKTSMGNGPVRVEY